MADIFISYSHQDRPCAQLVAQALEAEGRSVWWDRNIEISAHFTQVIDHELTIARCVIVLWSNSSRLADWVLDEAGHAKQRNVLVPIFIERVLASPGFGQIQGVILTNWDGDREDERFTRLSAHIEAMLRRPAVEVIELVPSLNDLATPRRHDDLHSTAAMRENAWKSKRNLAIRIENVANNIKELNILVLTFVSALALLALAYGAHLRDLVYQDAQGIEHQVGFWWAPNWTVVYLILFPGYNLLFCSNVDRFRSVLDIFVEQNIIAAPDGLPVNPVELRRHWENHLGLVSITLWALVLGVGGFSFTQWIYDCLLPNYTGQLSDAPIDWATFAVAHAGLGGNRSSEIWFSAVAYVYMAIALWIYAAVFVYGATFAWYLRDLSTSSGRLRLVWRGEGLTNELRDVVGRIFVGLVLGFLAAYCMRLQSAYLTSNETNVIEYMFSGERALLRAWSGGFAVSGFSPHPGTSATSAGTSWAVAVYAFLMFSGSLSLIYVAFNNSKNYFLSHLRDAEWRRQARVLVDHPEQVDALAGKVKDERFLSSVLPYPGSYLLIAAGLFISAAQPKFGSLLLLTLLFGIGHLLLRHGKSPGGNAHES